jgi:hypothetical protein
LRELAAETISSWFSVICGSLRTAAATVGMALAVQVIEQVLKRQSNSKSLHFPGELQMQIENLSKELDTETMADVRGGLALTGQVVPTNIQSNELIQKFDIASNGPVAIANDGTQSNDSSQPSFVPVGSLFVDPTSLLRTLK